MIPHENVTLMKNLLNDRSIPAALR